MSTIKVDTIATRTGSGNITLSNNVASLTSAGAISGTNLSASGTLAVTGNTTMGGTAAITGNTTVGGTLVNTGLITASAGVAIGGTGSANTLDDYEEGTFTPAFNTTGGGESFTYSAQNGYYLKIGAYVWVSMNLSWSNRSGGSGQLRLGNLPFAPAGANRRALMGMPYSSCWTGLSNAYNIQPHSNMVSASAGTYYWRTSGTGNIADYINSGDLASSGTLQTVLGYESSA